LWNGGDDAVVGFDDDDESAYDNSRLELSSRDQSECGWDEVVLFVMGGDESSLEDVGIGAGTRISLPNGSN
jgi:hypothetical protein